MTEPLSLCCVSFIFYQASNVASHQPSKQNLVLEPTAEVKQTSLKENKFGEVRQSFLFVIANSFREFDANMVFPIGIKVY